MLKNGFGSFFAPALKASYGTRLKRPTPDAAAAFNRLGEKRRTSEGTAPQTPATPVTPTPVTPTAATHQTRAPLEAGETFRHNGYTIL